MYLSQVCSAKGVSRIVFPLLYLTVKINCCTLIAFVVTGLEPHQVASLLCEVSTGTAFPCMDVRFLRQILWQPVLLSICAYLVSVGFSALDT